MTRPVLSLVVVLVLSAGAATAQWVWTPETGRFVRMDNLPRETPELQVEYTRSLIISGNYDRAFNETDKFERFYAESDYADDNQFLRGEIKLEQGDYLKSAKEFQQVISAYPESELYDDVIDKQYEAGDLLFDKGRRLMERQSKGFRPWHGLQKFNPFRRRPLKKAIEVYTMVIENQPFTPEAAKAQYKIAQAHFTREEYVEASFEYRRVIEDYPGSEWVREASHDLTRSYEEMALEPEYDQAPSQLAMDTVDEFVRRFPDDPRVDDRLDTRETMRSNIAEQRYKSAHFYERRKDLNAARIYYEITAYEFTGTKSAEKARAWLEEHPPRQDLRDAFVGAAVVKVP